VIENERQFCHQTTNLGVRSSNLFGRAINLHPTSVQKIPPFYGIYKERACANCLTRSCAGVVVGAMAEDGSEFVLLRDHVNKTPRHLVRRFRNVNGFVRLKLPLQTSYRDVVYFPCSPIRILSFLVFSGKHLPSMCGRFPDPLGTRSPLEGAWGRRVSPC